MDVNKLIEKAFSREETLRRTQYYANTGAALCDLGMTVLWVSQPTIAMSGSNDTTDVVGSNLRRWIAKSSMVRFEQIWNEVTIEDKEIDEVLNIVGKDNRVMHTALHPVTGMTRKLNVIGKVLSLQ